MFRRRRFLTGADAKELGWYTPAGTAMTDADWDDHSALAVAIYLDGSDSPDRAVDGSLLIDDDFYLLVNAWWEPVAFTIPGVRTPADGAALPWQTELSTYVGVPGDGGPSGPDGPLDPSARATVQPGAQLTVGPRSLTILHSPQA